VTTPGRKLAATFALALEGLTATELPPEAKPFVPSHFAITPTVSGIDLADLDALIMAATAPPQEHPDIDARIAALMAHGIAVGLDTLAFNLGPADFSGTGKLTAYSPQKIAGAADLKATGFDQLVQQALKTPALGQAVPMLAIMRSLARPEGDALVWAVRLDNSVVTVNGHDLTGLFGAPKPEPGKPEPSK
jgi:stage V sporulation protein SpoVS